MEIVISFGTGALVGVICGVVVMALCAANGIDNEFNSKDKGDD